MKTQNKIFLGAKNFVDEVCKKTWQMSDDEVKKYCQMIIKQNMAMAKLDKEYLETAKAYMKIAEISKEEVILCHPELDSGSPV